jgi:hypothetical protein
MTGRMGQLSFGFLDAEPAPPARAEAPPPAALIPLRPSVPRLEDAPRLDRHGLERHLGRILDRPVRVTLTDNVRTMLSSRQGDRLLEVRLHRMFLRADPKTRRAVAAVLDGDRSARRVLQRFIASHRTQIRRRKRVIRLRPAGNRFDLKQILEGVRASYFPGVAEDEVRIGWSRRPPASRRQRRSIRLGTYVREPAPIIRIHPRLDREEVPEFFVAFVVFHELLHHAIPPRREGHRMLYHPPEFQRLERLHPDYDRATAWEKANLDLLLRD